MLLITLVPLFLFPFCIRLFSLSRGYESLNFGTIWGNFGFSYDVFLPHILRLSLWLAVLIRTWEKKKKEIEIHLLQRAYTISYS